MPLFNSGFSQVNASFTSLPNDSLRLRIGDRYIHNNPYLQNSNVIDFNAYHAALTTTGIEHCNEEYELQTHLLQSQEYAIHRDLSAWVATLGVNINSDLESGSSRTVNNYGLVLTFTLKNLPSLQLARIF